MNRITSDKIKTLKIIQYWIVNGDEKLYNIQMYIHNIQYANYTQYKLFSSKN